MVSAEAQDDSSAIVVDGTCRRQFNGDNLSSSCKRLSPEQSSVSSVSTSTECTKVPAPNIHHSTAAANRSTGALKADQYQSVTPPPPPRAPPHPLSSLFHPKSEPSTEFNESRSLIEMLNQTNSDQNRSGNLIEHANRRCVAGQENSPVRLRPRQQMPPIANTRQLHSFPPDDCCSCRSIVTEPDHLDHRVLSDATLPSTTTTTNKHSEDGSESSQFIFYLLLKKLFSIFRRRRKKDRMKRRIKPGTERTDVCQANPAAGGRLRRSGSGYSRCSMTTRRPPIKLTGHCRFDPNVTFCRPPSRRYSSNCDQTKPLLINDCEECRREAQAMTLHRRPPPRRVASRRLRRQPSAVERFARQHRFIMSMLGRQRFGVSKMFEQLNGRVSDYRPNYQFLNQLLYQGVIRNRMSGYRYNLIRPILADVPEDEEVHQQQQQQHSPPRAKSRQRQNSRHYQPPPPPPPVPPPSADLQNCCGGEGAYTRSPPSRLRAPNGPAQPPVPPTHSKVSNRNYGRSSCDQAPVDRVSRQARPPSRQSRLVQAPIATDCIDCIISQLSTNRPKTPPSICTCCECQPAAEEPSFKCSDFFPLLPRPSTNRRSSGLTTPGNRNMSTRRRKMMCKKFDSMVVQESFQCHAQQVSVTRAEQHYGGPHSSTAALAHRNPPLYQDVAGKSRRTSLPTSSSSECSSSGSSRTSKYLQQCTCCIGTGHPAEGTLSDWRPSTSNQTRHRFAVSQFTVPRPSQQSNGFPPCSTSVMQVPPHGACFCPGCITTHNMAVAKL